MFPQQLSPVLLTSSTAQGEGLSPPRGSPGDLGQPRHLPADEKRSFGGWERVCSVLPHRSGPQESPSICNSVCTAPHAPARGQPHWAPCTDCAVRMFMRCLWVRREATTLDSVNSLQGSALPGLSLKLCPRLETQSDSAARSYRACSSTAGSSCALLVVGTAGRPRWVDRQADEQRSRPVAGLYSSGMCRQCLARS